MKSPVLDALLQSPVSVPSEWIQDRQRALEREQRLREKFYADITPEHKWEFIQGEIVTYAPALSRHLLATMRTYKLLDAYVSTRSLGGVYVEKAMTCFPRNDYEPDVMFFGTAKSRPHRP
ncbi:MAG TPA: Uma2 family endonuclease [Prosthecobacter sp.]